MKTTLMHRKIKIMLTALVGSCALILAFLTLSPVQAKPPAAVTAVTVGEPPSAFVSELAPEGVQSTLKPVLLKRMQNIPSIDEIRTTPVKGLYELRIGRQVVYSDEKGEYLINGNILETGTQRNLTQERVDKINALVFSKMPLADAVKIVRGNGARKVALFEDPNCGYCKRFEQEIKGVTDITIYTFLYPILGDDSMDKVRNIWCAKDKSKAWENWMLNGVAAASAAGDKSCNVAAITRNIKYGAENGINGTPGLVFEDGTRAAGAMSLDAFNKRLTNASKAKAS